VQLRIHARGLHMPRESRRMIELSARLAIGRHANGVDVARIHLSRRLDANGRETQWCEVRARLRRGGVVSVEEAADDLHTAAKRAARRLARVLDRRREIAACGFGPPVITRRREDGGESPVLTRREAGPVSPGTPRCR
jgi:ribosome-associated translation inhibitor RaiA